VLAVGGNYAAALLCYRELRLHLHRELNTAPDLETQTLFQRLRSEARRLAAKGSEWQGLRVSGQGSVPTGMPAPFPTPAPCPPTPAKPRPPVTPSSPELPAAVLREALSRAPVVGREAELAVLARRLAAAGEGRGSTCLLAGEPGIGKTRLATEACSLARQRGFSVLAGRCDEHGAGPYQPFGEALRAYLDRASPAQAQETLPPPVAAELVRLVPRLAEPVPAATPVAATAGAAARPALMEAMGDFFARLAAGEGHVLLFLDDLHWADEGSLAMLHHLARRAAGLPLLIIGTYRDLPPDLRSPLERTLAALNRERLAERLPLRRLPEAHVGQMVAALLEQPLPLPPPRNGEGEHSPPCLPGKGAGGLGRFVTALHQETEGNPFFVEEVLQHLVEEGAITRQDGRWQMALPAEFRVPPSVQAAIGRRLERLGGESREAVRLAAVIGLQFDFEVLLAASGVEEERLVEWVEEWLGARLVIEEPFLPATVRERYRFQHALIREVLYGGISRPRQGRLHERVGLALEAAARREEPLEELAHHFARARSESAREKGVAYCLRAGGKAHSLSADAEAIPQFRSALRLLDGLPEDEAHWKLRWQATDGLAGSHRVRLEWELARQVVEEYRARAERAGCAWGIARAHSGMAQHIHLEIYVRNRGDSESARRHAETSLALCEREGLADLLPEVSRQLAWFLMREPGSDLRRAAALLRQVQDSCEPRQQPVLLLTRLYAKLGKWDEVMAALRESIAAGGVADAVLFGLNLLEEALDAQGRQAEFLAFCEDARRRLAQTGAACPLTQWYLEPARPSARFSQVAFQDDFEGPAPRAEWQWCDPLQVSAYRLGERAGCVTLHAAEGTDLDPNTGFNAPRLLLEVRGEFALEVRMEGDWEQQDQIGSSGLLVWKDPRNFLRLDKFCMDVIHYGSVGLAAMVQGEFRTVGRGFLRGSAFHLRLEREGERFTALARRAPDADGIHWLTCGQIDFPARDPLLVGIASLRGVVAHFDWVRVLTKP
jgi:AAA ATPase domain